MTEPDRIEKLEIHLGNLTSRFDALEGRTAAVETQVDEALSAIQRLYKKIELIVKNQSKLIGITESNVKTANGISENVRMLTEQITMIIALDKIRNGEDIDAVIAALPDEELKRAIRRRIEQRRKQ